MAKDRYTSEQLVNTILDYPDEAIRVKLVGDVTLGAGMDENAIHVNEASEIYNLTEKGLPVDGDLFIIEDSEDGFNKKAVSINALPFADNGEANTASNVGVGAGLYKEKELFDLKFRSLLAGSAFLDISFSADEVIIDVSVNDAGTANNELWSAARITSALSAKADTAHTHTGIYEPANTNIQAHIVSTSDPHQTIPDQAGASGYMLSTNGTTLSWTPVPGGGDMMTATYDPAGKSAQVATESELSAHTSDLTLHRIINDSGSSSTELFSSNKITNELAGKEGSFVKNTAFNKDFGTGLNTVCQGNDARLSDARTPTAHADSHVDGTDDIRDATASQRGLMTLAYAGKLDGIEAGAKKNNISDANATLLTGGEITDLHYHDTWNEITGFVDTASVVNQIPTTEDYTSLITPGMGLKYKLSGTYYRGIVTGVSSTAIALKGIPLTTGAGDLEEVYYDQKIITETIKIPGTFTSGSTDPYIIVGWRWGGSTAYLVHFAISSRTQDSTASPQPGINLIKGGNDLFTQDIDLPAGVYSEATGNPIAAQYEIAHGDIIKVKIVAGGGSPSNDAEDLTVNMMLCLK